MHAPGARVCRVDEDAPRQFSLDVQVELLHIPRLIGSCRELQSEFAPASNAETLPDPSKRSIDIRTERPISRAIQRSEAVHPV